VGFFLVLLGVPRGDIEEGGHMCVLCVHLGELIGCATSYKVGLSPNGRGDYPKNNLWRTICLP
jgi:hypothetical protein